MTIGEKRDMITLAEKFIKSGLRTTTLENEEVKKDDEENCR